jgi:methyl-accepting chemotaxis protein
MGIKFKILSGFLILAAMLAIAGIWSVIEIRSIGDTVETILDKEYASVASVKKMKEALEREDSGILLTLLGKSENGLKIINNADSVFTDYLSASEKLVTNNEEAELLKGIRINYSKFITHIKSPKSFSDNEDKLDWYFEHPHEQFIATMELIDNFMSKNDQAVFKNSKMIIEKSHRAIMPGIVAVVAAIVFSVVFHSLINFYFITPIIEITKRIRKFTSQRLPYDYKVESKDELNDLNEAVDILCSHVLAEKDAK